MSSIFPTKDYLLVECTNVEQTLHETLRYRYIEGAAAEYYAECASRLSAIKSSIELTDSNDIADLQQWAVQLSALSGLITHIERSHLEEFSWPFAHALQRVSTDICTEPRLPGKPLFFFMAEGGAASYAVRPDWDRLGIRRRSIYSVIFPRTLKDYVLLHTIFGHEIGHAAWFARGDLAPIARQLIKESPVADGQKLFEWCKTNTSVRVEVGDQYLAEKAESWAQEMLSDLFGLVVMGPSFLPAFQVLLEPLYSQDVGPYVPTHPPYPCRIVALLHAARALNLLYSERQSEPFDCVAALDAAFVNDASKWTSTAFAILDEASVKEAAVNMANYAKSFSELSCPAPDKELLSSLVAALTERVPPVLPFPPKRGGGDALEDPAILDFRHIIHAGWIRWSEVLTQHGDSREFPWINRFCAHAILQQEGIRKWRAGLPRRSTTT